MAAMASNGWDKIWPLVCVSIRSPNEGTEAEAESWVESGRPSFSMVAHSG